MHAERTDTLRGAYIALLREERGLNAEAAAAEAEALLADSGDKVRTRVEDFHTMAGRLDAVLATVLLASLGLVAVVLWGITVNVIQPLRRVAAHCERMAAGDLSEPVERRGNNEIGQLYNGLGRMRDNLAAIVGQVRTSSDTIHAGSRKSPPATPICPPASSNWPRPWNRPRRAWKSSRPPCRTMTSTPARRTISPRAPAGWPIAAARRCARWPPP